MRPRLFGFLLGSLLSAILFVSLGRRASNAQVCLSEDAGRIEQVEIHYRKDAKDIWPTLESFFRQISPSVDVIAICANEKDAADLRSKWVFTNPLHIVRTGFAISSWSKDRFLVTSSQRPTLLVPRQDQTPIEIRRNDARVASVIASTWPGQFSRLESDLAFDAGDILVSDRVAIYNQELSRKNPSVNDLSESVQKLTGRQPLQLTDAPGHHIGMFAAPLAPDVIAVGDPTLGEKLLQGHSSIVPDKSAYGPFHHAISQLSGHFRKVVRLPLIPIADREYITYTNGVFEQRDGKKHVYMPWYDLPSLDNYARQAYEAVGYTVHPITVKRIYKYHGTIGCLVNVVKRTL